MRELDRGSSGNERIFLHVPCKLLSLITIMRQSESYQLTTHTTHKRTTLSKKQANYTCYFN